ncbi:Putative acyl-CoA dehydrogenase FadE17 [Alphaproteobacteria bacterium SO-S41]|nr:Putative acyl-CoA dehydrogenase FadE17 [Alphaproteobacteria bacterium SO-S41]
MSETDSTELAAFRAEAQGWIAANFPASLKGRAGIMLNLNVETDEPDFHAWKKAMGAKGWGVPTWPKQYGGGGLSKEEAKVLSQEMMKAGAFSPIGGMGVMMFGPTLLEYGTEAQKQRFMPGIVNGTTRWCQGFSEPGAGSDLASLSTKCEDKGDHWLVNGQKIWTSGAQHADWIFCLVRTDPTRKHEGISFLLFDMKSPGVEVRPIQLISGNSPFCETFFTDVEVPKDQLMGPLNGGWTIAKRLLQFERNALSNAGGGTGGGTARMVPEVVKLAEKYVGRDAEGRIADPDLRQRLIAHHLKARAFGLTLARVATETKSGQGPSAATSIMKNAGSKIAQERAEFAIEMMGNLGLGWEGDDFNAYELGAVRGWLGSKVVTIYGGSTEIQNNITAKRMLGLLDHQ